MNRISLAILLCGLMAMNASCLQQNSVKAPQRSSDATRPHSPYLQQRDTLDNGFSKGWMPHFVPSEEYWVDVHVHLNNVTSDTRALARLLDEWFSRLDAYRLGKVIMITTQDEFFSLFDELNKKDPRFAWMYWPPVDKPSAARVREAIEHGACALKLHNNTIMSGKVPREIYDHPEWQAIFSYADAHEIPLLWHVTQRHSYSPYHGGGLNAYWQQGWAAGVTFTNEDLLQDVLTQMRRFPHLKVIGAHQLHVGLDRLTELFQTYPNLYIDSSCGMYLRWADEFIEDDRLLLRNFVERWSDRILFGTDSSLSPDVGVDEYAVQGFLCHPRFMLKLRLSDATLQKVAWRNAQQLMHLQSVSSARRGSVRP